MEKMNYVLAAFVLAVAIPGAFGTPDECVPEGDLFCRLPRRGGMNNAPVYYLLPDGTKCNAGCTFPLDPNEDRCPIGPSSRRSTPDLFRRSMYDLPAECSQLYLLYVDVGDRICRLRQTFNAACVTAARNN